MTALTKREPTLERFGMFDRFDRMFDDWMKVLPLDRQRVFGRWWTEDVIHVDEFLENGTLVIRADLPGIDPDKDVHLSVVNGRLAIEAERHEESEVDRDGSMLRELRYGKFSRVLPLGAGVTASSITATYKDGLLEVRIPGAPTMPTRPPARIPITTS